MPAVIEKEGVDMQEMKVVFGGETHQVEANTFLTTLLPFVSLVQEVAKEIDPSKKIEIKINAEPRPGSFIIDFLIQAQKIIDEVKGLFSSSNMDYAAGVVTTVGGLYGLVKFLKGSKPAAVETNSVDNSVKITNGDGTVTNIDNRVLNIYINNKAVRHSITQSFEALASDETVTSFEIHDRNDTELANIPSQDFSVISDTEDAFVSKDEKVENQEVRLSIISMDWDLKKKWGFIYLGNKISAKIKDDAFKEAIDKGERFAKGDSLRVELEIKQVYDEPADTFINSGYTVIKILEHIPRSEPPKLFE